MNALVRIAVLSCAFFTTACTVGPESPRGFRLPAGDPAAGRVAFEELRCNDCHEAEGVALRDSELADIQFVLGGPSTRITTYGSLVTSIINPSHKLSTRYPRAESSEHGESRMPVYNDVMSVQELIDIVAYLQPQYELIVVSPNSYETYYP
jgi:mono/diheme cytochrome c family protein